MKRVAFLILVALNLNVAAQESIKVSHTLDEVINLAMENSVDAMMARNTFLGSYWLFRTYRAQLLPSFSVNGSLPNFDRSITSLQDPQTGEYRYIQNYAMRNNVGVNVVQNLGFTGGTISLYSGLDRLDQFSPERGIFYNSAPVSLILSQPIGSFNKLRWDKKIEPARYELAKFTFLEARENIISTAVNLFFNQLMAQRNLEIARQNNTSTDTLYQISKRRFDLGTISQSELLQLKLRLLNEGVEINKIKLQLNLTQAQLRSYLGYNEKVDITLRIPDEIPKVEVALDTAYKLTMENTSFAYQQKVKMMEAEKAVAQAKADLNPQLTLYARFGLNQVSSNLRGAYKSPLDQETVRLGVIIPIFNGGVTKGRLRMSLSQQDLVEATLKKEAIDRKQDIYLKVMQFNNQGEQCEISRQADEVAEERYRIATKQFTDGKLSVLELNTAQAERNSAHNQLISELYNFWNYYYTIQRMTLFDFRSKQNISAEFDSMTQ